MTKLNCGCKPKIIHGTECQPPEDMCEAHRLEWLTLHHAALKIHKARMAAFNDALLGAYRWEDVT